MTRDLSSLRLQSLEILDYLILFFGGGACRVSGETVHLRPHTRQPPGLTLPPAGRQGNAPSAGTGVPEPGSFLPFFLSFLNRSSENQAVGQGPEAGEGRREGCL